MPPAREFGARAANSRSVSSAWRAAVIGALVAALATLPGLGVGTLWDNSETAYGEVAREILIYHDPIVLHFNGVPWFVQPPLYFWIAAAFAHLFGLNEFTLRLPSALATIAMGGAVGYVVARTTSSSAALLAATVLSTSLMQVVVGRLAIMDALLDLAVAIAILSAFAALRTGAAQWWYVCCGALAFGMLAKGPAALVVTAIVIVPWAIWERRSGGRVVLPSAARWILGAALFAAIVGPWAILLYRAAGSAAFAELVGHYTVGRYIGTIENQGGPLYYYVPVIILGTFPWFPFLVPGVLASIRAARDPAAGAPARLCLSWAVIPFVFFSLAQTKLPNYIALQLPAFAIMIAIWFDEIVRRDDRRAALAWTAVVPFTIGGLAFAISAFSHDNKLTRDLSVLHDAATGATWAILIGSALCFILLLRKSTAIFGPFVLGATSVATLLILAIVAEPLVEPFKPIPPLAAVIQRERQPSDLVAIEGVSGENALIFYTVPPVEALDLSGSGKQAEHDPRRGICAARRVFVVTSRTRSVPTYGRTRSMLAVADKDALYLYEGPRCKN